MTAVLIAAGTALLVAMLATPLLIRWLRAHGIGQQIREDGPEAATSPRRGRRPWAA